MKKYPQGVTEKELQKMIDNEAFDDGYEHKSYRRSLLKDLKEGEIFLKEEAQKRIKTNQVRFRVWTGERMIEPTEFGEVLIKGDGRLFCWIDIAENSGLAELNKDDYVIMLYSEKKDKNKKTICVGDILVAHEDDITEDKKTQLVGHHFGIVEDITGYPEGWEGNIILEKAEIIGNIFE